MSEQQALIDYILQDDIHNRLTPRIVDIAYTAFNIRASGKNPDDGGPCDWFNDTKPVVQKAIDAIKRDLAACSVPNASTHAERVEAIKALTREHGREAVMERQWRLLAEESVQDHLDTERELEAAKARIAELEARSMPNAGTLDEAWSRLRALGPNDPFWKYREAWDAIRDAEARSSQHPENQQEAHHG